MFKPIHPSTIYACCAVVAAVLLTLLLTVTGMSHALRANIFAGPWFLVLLTVTFVAMVALTAVCAVTRINSRADDHHQLVMSTLAAAHDHDVETVDNAIEKVFTIGYEAGRRDAPPVV